MKQFYKLYQEVLKDDRLTSKQMLILTTLLNRGEYHDNKPFYCYEKWIASEVRCSERTIKRAIKHIAELGYINIERVYNKREKKTINYYTINFDCTNTKPVEKIEMASGTDKPTEQINNNNIEKIDNNMIDIENTYIPDELLYPAEYVEALTMPLYNTPKKEDVVIDDDVKKNIKMWLLSNVNKQRKGTIYYPSIRDKYGYSFKQVIESAKQLAEEKVIEYNPVEKDGKLYHYYNVPTNGTIQEWENICKKVYGTSKGDNDYINKISGYTQKFIENGISENDLIEIMLKVKNAA